MQLLINKMKSILIILSLFVPLYIAADIRSSALISYTLWIGSLPEDGTITIHNLDIREPNNTSFYDIMQVAAKENINYQFKAKHFDFGHYITEIGGRHELPSLNYYWSLYKTRTLPDPWNPPSNTDLTPKGVDETFIKDGDHYLFWFHKIQPEH